jgi:endonuclease/exonuclease/phosphatase family metal-dependent hydrolase
VDRCAEPAGAHAAAPRLTVALASVAIAVSACVHAHSPPQPKPPAECRSAVDGNGAPATIAWAFAAEERDRVTLDDWCRAVGPAVIAQEKTARSTTDDFVVATWNMHLGGGNIDELLDHLRDPARPDRPVVLLVQEAFRRGPLNSPRGRVPRRIAPTTQGLQRASVTTLAAQRGLSLAYVPSMRNGSEEGDRAEDRGNAILSTLPLSDVTAIELPFEHQRRVAVAATVRLVDTSHRDWTIRVVSTHFDAQSAWRHGRFLFWFGRTRQAEALTAALALGSDRTTTASILGGDFNSVFGELEQDVHEMRRRFPQTPPSHIHVTFPLIGRLGLHLDHLFTRIPPGWRTEMHRAPERWGSDHYAVIGHVSLRPAN